LGKGYRPATAEEIAEHWKVLHSRWTPEPGDKVIVTQDIGMWHNKRGTIVEDGGDDYWVVRRDDDDHTCNFKREDQMILAPYEETVVKPDETSKSTIPPPKEGYVTIRIFTEEEFKAKDLWNAEGYPQCWNNEGKMNKYLGTYMQVSKSKFDVRASFVDYEGWGFRSTDYEVIHGGVEFKKPEVKPQRFKVGDQVTYKSKSSCDGYKYGGDDHDGYVGTITSYGVYRSEYDCYGIHVTCKEGGNYSMLESEFYEYDGLYPGAVTLGTSAGAVALGTSSGTDFRVTASGTTSATSLPEQTWTIQVHPTHPQPQTTIKDNLAEYQQAPLLISKKPKRSLIVVDLR
jgi:hypothetical protein